MAAQPVTAADAVSAMCAGRRSTGFGSAMWSGWTAVGKILRHIAAFEWASASLIGGWPPRGVRRMSVRLEDAQTASALEF